VTEPSGLHLADYDPSCSTAVPGYVRAVDGVRGHILHVVTLESWPTRNQRLFRDYLRAHPADALRYAQLKQTIVAAGTGPGEYARAKTALVQELTDRARSQLGLPPVAAQRGGGVGGTQNSVDLKPGP